MPRPPPQLSAEEPFGGTAVDDLVSPPRGPTTPMPTDEPFTFGIALIPRASAQRWPLIEALLDLTLSSVRAQTDPDFRVVIAGHDRPGIIPDDARFSFLEVDWPAQGPDPRNADRGRKKDAINDVVLARGGGLLMFLDADDWVHAQLVESARATLRPDCIGALIETGFASDVQTLTAAALPDPRVFDGAFHRVCGSSAVARLRPDHTDPLRRDPWNVLDAHHQWVELAREHGAELTRLPVPGNYVINTSENHSELHGPYAAWRRTFTEGVNLKGRTLDDAIARQFGLSVDRIRSVSERFFQSSQRPRAAGACSINNGRSEALPGRVPKRRRATAV
jgi:hypothetical protein